MLSKVTVAAAATVAFLLASPVTAFPAGCTRNYTVVAGDICDSISKANNVSTYQLAVVNRDTIDSTCSNLIPGEVICLGTEGEDCRTTYVVASGDSCGAIETKFGVNATVFGTNNPQINQQCTNIYPGEVLCVSTTVQAPPVPTGFFTPSSTGSATSPTTSTNTNTGSNSGLVSNGGSGSTDGGDDDVEWIPVSEGDPDYSDDLPICGDA